jgi:hypothetical protein
VLHLAQSPERVIQVPEVLLQSSAATELIALASEKSSEKRLELLRRITGHFLHHSAETSAASQYLVDEILDTLVERLRDKERAAAAADLSQMKKLPDDLARRLANDLDIDVARPILREYRALPENVLSDIATSGSQAHLLAIAGRETLAPRITDIVVGRGDREVVHELAANKGARFSQFGMRTLVGKAEKDAQLRDLIVDRCDLTFEAVGQLLPLISQELASRLQVANLSYNPVVVQEQLVSWMSDRKKNIDKVKHYVDGIKRGNLSLDKVVLDLVLSKRLLDVATVIAGIGELDRDHAYNILTQGQTEHVAVLLKSLRMSWAAVEAFLKLRVMKLGQDICGVMIRQSDYELIDEAAAQRVMRFLKVRRAAMAEAQNGSAAA